MQHLTPARLLEPLAPEVAARLEIPKDLIRHSRHRLRLAAALGAAVYAVFLVSQPFRIAGATSLERSTSLINDFVGLGLCGAVLMTTLIRRISDRAVLHVALVAEVVLAATISITGPIGTYLHNGTVPALTWAVPLIIIVPVLLAAPPARTLPAALICALSLPTGLWLLAARGYVVVHAADYWRSATVAAVAFGIAAIAARVVHATGQQVAAARTFGSYELLEPLGRGGMGEVWKARHRLLARPAALKFIRVEHLKGGMRVRDRVMERFWIEARVTANLRSPHTVELFDFGMSTTGTLYYAMELLDGVNLERFVYEHGAIEPRRAVNWLRQVCHSLAEAHAVPLVHRDLKPANLFVCRYGLDRDVVKVLDFGLASLAMATGVTISPSPRSLGAAVGTPSYMAPEVALGSADARTDLYAVGCIGFWLLAGRKPFEADSAEELMRLHAEAEPPSLSALAPHPLPAGLERIIHSCLAKDPRQRPADAATLATLLEESLEGAPWTQADARAWWSAQRPAG
jgi:serine/threonine-protein kinase